MSFLSILKASLKRFTNCLVAATMITSVSVQADEIKDFSFAKSSGDNKWYKNVFGTWYSSENPNESIFFQINFPWINYSGQGNCSGSVALLDNHIHFKMQSGFIGPYEYFEYLDGKMLAVYPDGRTVEFIRDENKFPIEKRKMLMKQMKLLEFNMVITGPNDYKFSFNFKADNPNASVTDGIVTISTENTPYENQERTYRMRATYLQEIIIQNDLSEWSKLPVRKEIGNDEYQADVTVNFNELSFNFNSKQKLPETKALVFQRLYSLLLSPIGNQFNPFFEHTIGEIEKTQYAYVRNKKIPIINGTGSTSGDLAILNYGDKIWWIEEGITGEYEFLRNNTETIGFSGVNSAHMTIREDGSISIVINGESSNSHLRKYRKHNSSIQAGPGSFYFTNKEYTEIRFDIPGQPAPYPKSPIAFFMKKIK